MRGVVRSPRIEPRRLGLATGAAEAVVARIATARAGVMRILVSEKSVGVNVVKECESGKMSKL